MTTKGIKPRLLDIFCGAGGCAVGYARAGFEVVGVDNRPMRWSSAASMGASLMRSMQARRARNTAKRTTSTAARFTSERSLIRLWRIWR